MVTRVRQWNSSTHLNLLLSLYERYLIAILHILSHTHNDMCLFIASIKCCGATCIYWCFYYNCSINGCKIMKKDAYFMLRSKVNKCYYNNRQHNVV